MKTEATFRVSKPFYRSVTIIFVLFFLLPVVSSAQERVNSGTDFWYVQTTWWDNAKSTLYITSPHSTTGKVDLALFGYHLTYPFSVQQGETVTLPVPEFFYTMMVGHVEETSLHITSEKPIEVSVTTSTPYAKHTTTTLLPTSSLGYEYYSLNHEYIGPTQSEVGDFIVLATEDNTTVEITAKYSNVSYRPADVPFTIKLKAGESFRIGSLAQVKELTGSRIRSVNSGNEGRKKIAVFASSARQASVEQGLAILDYFYQQLYPVRLWGQEYVSAPVLTKPAVATYKIVAAHCNTNVSINGTAPIIINQGEYYQFSTDQASHIIADKPVSVAQYFQASWDELQGDPETIMLAPVEQAVTEISMFSHAYTNIQEHYINITIPSLYAASFRLDGVPVTFTPVPSAPAYSYALKQVGAGLHTLKANGKFNAVAYGTTINRNHTKATEK